MQIPVLLLGLVWAQSRARLQLQNERHTWSLGDVEFTGSFIENQTFGLTTNESLILNPKEYEAYRCSVY